MTSIIGRRIAASELLTQREVSRLIRVCSCDVWESRFPVTGPYDAIYESLVEKGLVTMERGEEVWLARATALGHLMDGLHA